jgi:hypothetical protein
MDKTTAYSRAERRTLAERDRCLNCGVSRSTAERIGCYTFPANDSYPEPATHTFAAQPAEVVT